MTDPHSDLVNRKQLIDMLDISDSNERRKRTAGHAAWPPHLRIGHKVYYRRAAVEEFLQAQEATSAAAGSEASVTK